jgi:hypothetical protein
VSEPFLSDLLRPAPKPHTRADHLLANAWWTLPAGLATAFAAGAALEGMWATASGFAFALVGLVWLGRTVRVER